MLDILFKKLNCLTVVSVPASALTLGIGLRKKCGNFPLPLVGVAWSEAMLPCQAGSAAGF